MSLAETRTEYKKNRKVIVIWLCVSVALAIIPYISSLSGDFVLDDRELIVNSPIAHSLANAGSAFTHHFLYGYLNTESLYYRPLVTISYQVNYAISGLNPNAFRVTNLLLNAIIVILVFLLARRLTGSIHAAGAGAVAFAVLPSHVESVAWISGRTDILACLFMLGSFMAFTAGYNSRSKFSWGLMAACSVLFGCALFSKESAIIFPLLLVAYVWIFHVRASRSNSVKWLFAVIIPIAIYIAFRHSVLGSNLDSQGNYFFKERLFRAGSVYATYLRMLFIPGDLRVFYGDLGIGGNTVRDMAAWAAPLGLIVLPFLARKRFPILAFGTAWVLISLIPASGAPFGMALVPGDRLVYMASVGSSVAFGWLIWKACQFRPSGIVWFPTALAILAVSYAICSVAFTYFGSQYYRTNLTWARRIAEVKPPHQALRLEAARIFADAGCVAEATSQYEAVAEMDWESYSSVERAEIENKIGMLYAKAGDLKQAINAFSKAVKADPSHGAAWRNLGHANFMLGNYSEAIDALRKAFSILEPRAKDHLELGRAYKGIGDIPAAKHEFEQAISQGAGTKAASEADDELRSLK